MEHPDVALVRRAFDLYERGRFDDLFELVAEDAELHPVFLKGGPYRGSAAVRRLFESAADQGGGWRTSDVTFAQAGHKVLASGAVELIGESRTPMRLPIAWLFTVTDGRLTRMVSYLDRRNALRAAEQCG